MGKVGYAVTAVYDIIGLGMFLAGRLAGNFMRGVDGCFVPIAMNPSIRAIYKDAEAEIREEIKKCEPRKVPCGFASME